MEELHRPGATRPYVIAWVFALIFYFLEYAVRSSPAVMLPELGGVFGIGSKEVGSLLGTYYYTYSLAGLVAGIALDRTGARYALPAGVLVVALGSALFAAPGAAAGTAGGWCRAQGRLLPLLGQCIWLRMPSRRARWLRPSALPSA
jgi:fucose permease